MTTLAENDVAAGQPRAKPAPLPLAQVDEATVSVRLVVRLLGPLEAACGDRAGEETTALGAGRSLLTLISAQLRCSADDFASALRVAGHPQ